MPEDVKFNAEARKFVIANWLDISQTRVQTTRAVVHLQGHVRRLGEDRRSPESNKAHGALIIMGALTVSNWRGRVYTAQHASRLDSV